MWKLLSHFLDKNFVKATVLLKNILRSSRSVTFTEKIWISFHWSNNEIFVKSLEQKKTWELIWRKINLFQLVKIDSYITHWFGLTKKHNIRSAKLELIWRFIFHFTNVLIDLVVSKLKVMKILCIHKFCVAWYQILRCFRYNIQNFLIKKLCSSYFFSLHSKFTLPYAKYLADGWTRYFRRFNQLSKPAEFQSYTSTIKKSPRCVSNKLFFC